MAIIKIIPEGCCRQNIFLLPEIKIKLLAMLKQKFKNDVTPEMWDDLQHHYDDSDCMAELFISRTKDMANDIVRDYFKNNDISNIDEGQIEYWAVELWDESQSFWSELSENIKQNLNFIGTLIESAKKETEELFPNSDTVFGEKATQLFIDLSFQTNVYDYSKVAKPHLVDIRRMINISGQIVEEIFSAKIFNEVLTVGEIHRKLESFLHDNGPDKNIFYHNHKEGNLLLRKPFLDNLKTVKQIRDPYSHGASPDNKIEDDFPILINALISKHDGVLSVLYKLLAKE